MRTRTLVIPSVVAAIMLAGCATPRGPVVITPEVRAKVKKVSVNKEVFTPPRVEAMGTANGGGGLLGMVIVESKNKAFNNELAQKLNAQEFLSQAVYSSFVSNLVQNGKFELQADQNATADAQFVLETRYVGFGGVKDFSFSFSEPPRIQIMATLFANPPFDLMRDDKAGGSTTEDPVKHVLLYEKRADIKGKTYNSREYYLTKEGFQKAFSEVIDEAVKKIMSDW